MEDGKATGTWRRMVVRLRVRLLWHVQGIALWLCRRPWLRYLPLPYPSISLGRQWQLQAQQMVTNGALPQKHFQKALHAEAFTASNLKDCMWLRDRLGWKLAFTEDPMLLGMLAAKSSKGMASRIRQEAIAESKIAAKKAVEAGKQLEAVRSLIGPKGGLPALKADLLKLAALVEVQVHDKITVEELKQKIKPVVQDIVAKAPMPTKSSGGASSHQEPPLHLTAKSKASAPVTPSVAPGTPSTSVGTTTQPPGLKIQDIHDLMAQQDKKYQAMLHQVMQHMMSLQQGMQANPMSPAFMTEGPMSYDLTASDSDTAMGQVGEHGWTMEEVQRAKAFEVGDFDQMTEQEKIDFNLQQVGWIQQDEQDLLKGPFLNP